MIKVGVSNRFLHGLQSVTNCNESGVDIGFPNFEFHLDVSVSEFHLVLINKLTEQITKFLILNSETIGIDLFWTELPADNVELISDFAEDWGPLDLVSGVPHDSRDESILRSHVIGKLTHSIIDRSVHFMALDEGLQAMSESGPLRDDHASLVGHWLRGVWSAMRGWHATEHVIVSNLSFHSKVHQAKLLLRLSKFSGFVYWQVSDNWDPIVL